MLGYWSMILTRQQLCEIIEFYLNRKHLNPNLNDYTKACEITNTKRGYRIDVRTYPSSQDAHKTPTIPIAPDPNK